MEIRCQRIIHEVEICSNPLYVRRKRGVENSKYVEFLVYMSMNVLVAETREDITNLIETWH